MTADAPRRVRDGPRRVFRDRKPWFWASVLVLMGLSAIGRLTSGASVDPIIVGQLIAGGSAACWMVSMAIQAAAQALRCGKKGA